MFCRYGGKCSGCFYINDNYREVFEKKKQSFLNSLPKQLVRNTHFKDICFEDPKIRNRMDLTFTRDSLKAQLGLYEIDTRKLVDIETCKALEPKLDQFLRKFREKLPPIKKGSLRIRLGSKSNFGLWFDFSNKDIKFLIDERSWLENLLSLAHIEVGQRRKALELDDNEKFRLKKESLNYWFSSFARGTEYPLVSQVASFTQPSIRANKEMIEFIESCLCDWDHSNPIVEIGAGIGNFSIPLSFKTESLSCLENDKWSLKCLKRNLESVGKNPRILNFDFNRLTEFKSPQKKWLLFLDPPRSGIPEISRLVSHSNSPDEILYVSCFPESFIRDSKVLLGENYEIKNMALVDQFPYTKHLEVIAHFKKKEQ